MFTAQLTFETGHLYLTLDEGEWLFDTGSPTSFGAVESLTLDDQSFSVPKSYMGMDADQLATFAEHPTCGLLGADVINEFNVLIDIEKQEISFSKESISLDGSLLELDHFMGIPLLDVEIAGESYQMFFDTGAQVSYFQHSSLASFPPAGKVTDFYPGYGQFETETHKLEAAIGGHSVTLRCGNLPKMLAAGLVMGGAKGIVGNEILSGRVVGYFPQSKQLVLA